MLLYHCWIYIFSLAVSTLRDLSTSMNEVQRNPKPGPASLETNTLACPSKHYHFYSVLFNDAVTCYNFSVGERWMEMYGTVLEW